ncbi:ribonuclease [Afipia sp. Root123D2]|uniref:Rne/Rng family ribonuclease n=1 Tax=Afipia sp. Root123D2 TaxID=1736436 RepID=UPI0006F43F5F|nr:Rne/Rng family ribonuclease [Afipia sp. Root123D2]KQW23575.1 ribonuclease [Afipia sp. Root123D2]
MPNKMLIDATHPEETRVVVVRGNRVEEFDFESAQRKQLRGNIYLAKVTRVEPSLQAAFIEYGGNRHGFLAFSEIHPDYYQIPVADRQALIEADERAHREAEEESENRSNRRRSRHRNARRRGNGDRVRSEIVEGAASDPSQAPQPHAEHQGDDHGHEHDHEHGETAHHDHENGHGHDHAHGDDHAEANDYADHAVADTAPAETAHGDLTPDEISATQPETSEFPAVAVATAAPADDAEHNDQDTGHDEAHDHDDHIDTAHTHDAAPQGDEHHDDDAESDDDDDDGEEAEDEMVESVGGDDVLEEVPERAFRPRRQYKIQEVIKRRQVMLVQVVKEERGNKGAALTTYLSLAGRYAVLMPNTARGGGISRKITSAQDRSRLKEVVQDLDVPEGMGIILRTAGASRSKPEIKRDFEYLIRMWETVRDTTLNSQAPTLVYEEGSLIKRSLRDLYNKEIDEVLVAGEAGYNEARDFMKMLMPSNVRAVKRYRDGQPLFSRMGVESQLDAMFSPTVTLRSGGYIVINQTEALVSIDVNSGRSTREHHIEDTALKTNLEAAEEVARQLRLRDLAGLIVIDFIDMDEKRNNRSVERKMSDCLRQDRARIQVGRISHFGLLEMSRQRIRASVLESTTEPCAQCGGTGHVRSVSSVALQLLRGLEENLMKGATHNLTVRTRTDVALYVLNHKRGHLRDLENSFKVTLAVIADPTISGQQSFVIDRGEQVHTLEAAKAVLAAQLAAAPALVEEPADDEIDETFEAEVEFEGDEVEAVADANGSRSDAEGDDGPRRKRRRRRRGRSDSRDATQDQDANGVAADTPADVATDNEDDSGDDDSEDQDGAPRADQPAGDERRPRRRGRRGGRRRRGGNENGTGDEGLVAAIADDLGPVPDSEASEAVADLAAPAVEQPRADFSERDIPANPEPAPVPEPTADEDSKPRRRSTVRERVSFLFGEAPAETANPPEPESKPSEPEAVTPIETSPQSSAPTETTSPRRGWWSRRSGE